MADALRWRASSAAFLAALTALVVFGLILLANAVRYGNRRVAVAPAGSTIVDSRAVERLGQAIRFETISPQPPQSFDPKPLLELHDFLRHAYPRVHAVLTREVVSQFSLLYTWQGSDRSQKPILLIAHLDVVPSQAEAAGHWTYPPFSGHIADGYVWGRGALDDKAAVLSILESVESLLAAEFRPIRTIYLAFGHDEETGGNSGAKSIAALLKLRGVKLDFVIDEGMAIAHDFIAGVTNPIALIGIAEKGRLIVKLTATSVGGHASMPPSQTAIGVLAEALRKLERHPMPARVTEPVKRFFAAIGRELPFSQRLALANLWLFEPLVHRTLSRSAATNAAIRTTITPTILAAGDKDNVLPVEANAILNIRILPGDTAAGVTEHLGRVINDQRLTIDVIKAMEPTPVSSLDSQGFRTIATTIQQSCPGVVPAPALALVRTDSEHYLSLSDAVYRFRPLRLARDDVSRIHGIDERIAIENYFELIRFYAQLLRNSAS